MTEHELKKKELKRYGKIKRCIERLEKKILVLTSRIETVKSPNYSSMPRGGTPITIDELLADKLELEKRIIKLRNKARELRREVLEEIDSIEDSQLCDILELCYIDCISFEKIAELKNYSTRQVARLHSKGISILVTK